MKIKVTNDHAGIDHQLRWDGGKKIQWVAPDGTARNPEEQNFTFSYPGTFQAAGKTYLSIKALCAWKTRREGIYKDIYGREIFCVTERFPCFDSYDYANENRYYRWFFIKENGRLTRVYYADERNKIEVTEDVASLEYKCRDAMVEAGWL